MAMRTPAQKPRGLVRRIRIWPGIVAPGDDAPGRGGRSGRPPPRAVSAILVARTIAGARIFPAPFRGCESGVGMGQLKPWQIGLFVVSTSAVIASLIYSLRGSGLELAN